MKKIVMLLFLALAINTLPSSLLAQSTDQIQIKRLPGWVLPNKASLPEHVPINEIDGGVYYLLVDSQVRAFESEPTQYYKHYAELVINQQGLEKSSQINIEYDPNFQSVEIYSLNVIRNNKIINKQESAKVSIIQRETDLESLLYDGRHTMNIILDDIRVGDTIEYSFSKTGDNPVFDDIFSYKRSIQWQVPVESQYIRVLWNKNKPLNTVTFNTHKQIKERIFKGYREYTIATKDTPAININSQSPDWYSPYASVFFSETGSWKDVVQWATPLYKNAIEKTPELIKLADKIKASSPRKQKQIVNALQFVQSEIRYLGIEMGANSHTPSKASETLQNRYGDCKDKAVLFISLLNLMGIDAYPALVHTDDTQMVSKYPANVNAFNHVLVKVILDKKHYWLDPTQQYQKGYLYNIYQPDYDYALVLNNTSNQLEKMKSTTNSSMKHIKDKFDLSKGGGSDVIFESETTFTGQQADNFRFQIADYGLTKLLEVYLDFYRDYYSDLEALEKLKVTKSDHNGRMYVKEKYLIKNFWENNDSEKKYDADFYANSIIPYFTKPKQLKRNSPYEIVHPVKIKHEIEVQFKQGNWNFENSNEVIDNPFFNLKYSEIYDKSAARHFLKYEYTSKSSYVEVADFDKYLAARKKAQGFLQYGIQEYYKQGTENTNQTTNNENTIINENETPTIDSDNTDDIDTDTLLLWAVVIYSVLLTSIIINWRLDARKSPVFDSEVFYPVSISKLYILSIITFNLYSTYWAYKNWKYIKKKENIAIMPFFRGLFDFVWYYPLFKRLHTDSLNRHGKNRVLLKPIAIVFAISYGCITLLSEVDYMLPAHLLIVPFLILPMVIYINNTNTHQNPAYAYNSRWLIRHYMLVVLFLPIVIGVVADDMKLIPSDKVMQGETLWTHDIKFMQQLGAFPVNEKVILFYGDDVISFRSDGNGFTKNYVFSYWEDDKTGLTVASEKLTNVKDIDIEFSTDETQNTIIKVIRENDSNIILYVSSIDGKDKDFVNKLNEQWKASRKSI